MPLYLIEILHQTTTWFRVASEGYSLYLIEILHQTTTAGHMFINANSLYLIEILHQTTTFDFRPKYSPGCILSKFYIKPQQQRSLDATSLVVSYRNSTSNHNVPAVASTDVELYLIEILHQTTTRLERELSRCKLYLIEILHQTTTTFFTIPFALPLYLIEILHQTTTYGEQQCERVSLYLIEILHQTTTKCRTSNCR